MVTISKILDIFHNKKLKSLNYKLFRELKFMKSQIITISMVLGIGIGCLVGFLSTYDSLKLAQKNFYTSHRFAHLFSILKKAPQDIKKQLNLIPGIFHLETRIITQALFNLTKNNIIQMQSATAQFISIPDGKRPILNQIFIKKGRFPLAENNKEILIGDSFAQSNNLKLGDFIYASINGHQYQFTIVGMGISPETIFSILNTTSFFPDDQHYTTIWINESSLASILDMKGFFNSIVFEILPQLNQQILINNIDKILSPFGNRGAYPRTQQTSHSFLQSELKGLIVQANIIPFIFFFVAIFLIYIVLNRLTQNQRGQIATLRSLGYTHTEIFQHFFKFSLSITLIGMMLGLLIGFVIGRQMTQLYKKYYHFPHLDFTISWNHFYLACFLSLIISFLGVYFAIKNLKKLSPAEAMKPQTPTNFESTFLEKIPIFNKRGIHFKMTLRGYTSQPFKTILVTIGMSFTLMIAIAGTFWIDTIDYFIRVQFFLVQRETVKVGLGEVQPISILNFFRNIPGVTLAEGYLILPIKVYLSNKNKNSLLVGVPQNNNLWAFLDKHLRPINIHPSGVFISRSLAQELNIKLNDLIEIVILDGRNKKLVLPVSQIIDEFMGSSIYLNLSFINQLLNQTKIINTVHLRSLHLDGDLEHHELNNYLKKFPFFNDVTYKQTAINSFKQTSAQSFLIITLIIMIFSAMITIGIIYNHSRITLAERDWELSTLMILGLHHDEVFLILLSDILILLILSIPLGLGLGVMLSHFLIQQMSPEGMQLPFIIYPQTFFYSLSVLLISVIGSLFFIRKLIAQLDLMTPLKTRI